MATIGFVGLGAMGSQLAGRMLDSGNTVYGTNRTKSKAQDLIDRGLQWRNTPREVAEAADVTFSMVTDDDALDAITSGPDGVLAGLADRKVYVDMSTVSPQASTALAARVRATGAEMVDAPVTGSIPQAQAGTLAIMVGGTPQAFATVQPLLRVLAQTVNHVGTNGQGLLLKLAINISFAAQTLAFSEGLLLAGRGGIDPHLAAEVMSTSSIGSPMLKAAASYERNPLVCKHVEGLGLDGLPLRQPHSHSDASRYRPVGLGAAITHAVELIEERPSEPWTTVRLAAEVHLSVRALQQGFRRDLATTPMTYLRQVRLRRAREALRTADRDATTVRAVAARFGILHMSRFAAAYREAFGEAPSDTLNRPP